MSDSLGKSSLVNTNNISRSPDSEPFHCVNACSNRKKCLCKRSFFIGKCAGCNGCEPNAHSV